jgi:serine phosphatase RsbU (regulator of sigma subunit)
MLDDDESSLLLCVADVSGKGLPASLLMSHMQATRRLP